MSAIKAAAVLALGAAAYVMESNAVNASGIVEDATNWVTDMTSPPDDNLAAANRAAFLMMIRVGEGTADPLGYYRIVGGGNAADLHDHPRIVKSGVFKNGTAWRSSAAGAYQFIVETWDRLQSKLDLPDFSEASQDAAALELIDEKGALGDVNAGRFERAIGKLNKVWASLPGSPYGQPTRTMDQALSAISANGGTIAA